VLVELVVQSAARDAQRLGRVSPVPAGGKIVQADADAAKGANKEVLQTIADSPYVFPTPEIEPKLNNYRVLEGDEVQTWNDLFNPIFLT